jgi:HEAT repeat protein
MWIAEKRRSTQSKDLHLVCFHSITLFGTTMANRGFDEQMAALDALKGRELDSASIAVIKKSLASRNNFIVAKAARLAEEDSLTDLVPDLLAAFDRFFTNPEKTDPQCWAKNALSRALARLECRDKDVFLRGLRHHQLEPTWGGRSDSAGTLRSNCAHALVACNGLDNQELLVILLDPLVDEDKTVRIETVRALAQLGEIAVPVLRLRTMIHTQPPEEPEVLGQCFAALLAIERDAAFPFVARFLEAGDDPAGEAAFALAETRSPAALAALLQRQKDLADEWFSGVLLSAIALTRLPEAINFLLAMIEREDREAPRAIEALCRTATNEDLRSRLVAAVQATASPRLLMALRENMPPVTTEK